jgi:hypothetical protein
MTLAGKIGDTRWLLTQQAGRRASMRRDGSLSSSVSPVAENGQGRAPTSRGLGVRNEAPFAFSVLFIDSLGAQILALQRRTRTTVVAALGIRLVRRWYRSSHSSWLFQIETKEFSPARSHGARSTFLLQIIPLGLVRSNNSRCVAGTAALQLCKARGEEEDDQDGHYGYPGGMMGGGMMGPRMMRGGMMGRGYHDWHGGRNIAGPMMMRYFQSGGC